MEDNPFNKHIPFPYRTKGSRIRPSIKNNTYHQTTPRESIKEFDVWCCVCKTNFKFKAVYKPLSVLCENCTLLKNKIMNMTLDETDFVPGPYRICVTYKIVKESHDGYCSDPGDLIIESKEIKIFYPLLRMITKEDISEDNKISTTNLKINLFEKPNEGCSRGSGVCNCKTTYKIKKVKIIRSLKDEIFC